MVQREARIGTKEGRQEERIKGTKAGKKKLQRQAKKVATQQEVKNRYKVRHGQVQRKAKKGTEKGKKRLKGR